ncbi:glycerate kinase type-2 family protein [Hephaestia mangrovi]|uniref:glycerate kinase type-2 family protein n=1 Tax=Hephaestia mangrovi TaxID=2873268 RepID=UPI001CA7B571|nr:glycerate kinase [Hephaestia mangrovi]MBY8829860.1 glycerate kinase [Hephaestia mangrovi]
MRSASPSPEDILRQLFDAAVGSALPTECIPRHLPPPPDGRTIVVGAGKAAAAMAQAVEDNWNGPLSGLVITRYGHALPCRRIEVAEAGHPVPDQAGADATRRLLRLVDDADEDDLVICLISGGGSALLAAPPPGVSLADEQQVVRSLLRCGATIAELNCVRKHLSLVKGGRLATVASPARLVTLVISDVPGDDVSTIASGPTVPDPTTSAQAIAILSKYDLAVPHSVLSWLGAPASETPKPRDLPSGDVRMIATPQLAIEAAARLAAELGYMPVILGSAIEGEAREVATMHAGIARQIRAFGQPAAPPCVLLSGGETSVTVRGAGRGGRNAEFLLSLAIGLDGMAGVFALAADTDGIDGTEDNAGAIIGPDILSRVSPPSTAARCLAQNDGYGYFERAGALLFTGPTFTNVNDFRAILIDPPAEVGGR